MPSSVRIDLFLKCVPLQMTPRQNVCVILVVEAAARGFLQGALFDPVYIHFPPYNRDQLVKLLINAHPDKQVRELYPNVLWG